MDTGYVVEFIVSVVAKYPWFGVFTSVVTLASAVAALTPTPKSRVLAQLYKVVDLLALNIGKAKDK